MHGWTEVTNAIEVSPSLILIVNVGWREDINGKHQGWHGPPIHRSRDGMGRQ